MTKILTLADWQRAENDLSRAYLKLRAMIPGAFDTPHTPSGEVVWATTEAALMAFIAEHKALVERHARVMDRLRQLVEEEANR